MAISALQPMIVEFIDTLTTRPASRGHLLAELVVADEGAALSGHTIAEAFHHTNSRTRVLAIERPDCDLIVAPSGAEELRAGDRLMIFGEEGDLEALSVEGLQRLR
jgi:Trk K+ transport system NAD-binding subunit